MVVGLESLAQISAARVLNTIAEGLALAGLTWTVLRIVPGRSALTRFAVWFSTLLAVVGLPVLVRTGSSADWHKLGLELSSSWAMRLFSIWAAIAGVLLIRLAGSLWHLRRLRQECREVDGETHPELMVEVAQHSTGRNMRLLVSDEVRVPTALGFFRPAVILPAWALEQLSGEELNLILRHEVAHLERWDDWTNLVQKILKAVFFFHPAVWWIDSRLSLEREIACDDLVLEKTSSPHRYAESLVALAEKVFAEKKRVRAALAVAQSALGRMRHTSRRIAEILHPGRTRQRQGWQPALVAITAVSAVAFLATPYVPQLISFQQQPSLSAASRRGVDAGVTTDRTHVPAVKASQRIPVPPISPVVPARAKVHRVSKPRVVMTNSTVDGKARKPNVILTKAAVDGKADKAKVVLTRATGDQAPLPMLLLVQSMETDSSRQKVWVFCVWPMSSDLEGYRQIEQTIVTNQI